MRINSWITVLWLNLPHLNMRGCVTAAARSCQLIKWGWEEKTTNKRMNNPAHYVHGEGGEISVYFGFASCLLLLWLQLCSSRNTGIEAYASRFTVGYNCPSKMTHTWFIHTLHTLRERQLMSVCGRGMLNFRHKLNDAMADRRDAWQ